MDYAKMTAPCGLACFECIVFKANESEALREMISKKTGMPKDKIGCEGCRQAKGLCPVLPDKMTCAAYSCAMEKGVEFCYQCDDFPCDHLHPHADRAEKVPHNTKLFNLCLIKKMGLENWAENKAKNIQDVYFNGKLFLGSK